MDPIPAQSNVRSFSVVARADFSPITAGTVNLYVVALTGANAGKWFKTSDNSWDLAENVAAGMAHISDGAWTASVDAECWIDGVDYLEYAKESGDLHVPVSRLVRCHPDLSTQIASIANTVAIATTYLASTIARTVGDNDGGAASAINAHDDSYYATGEVSGTGLQVDVTRATSDTSLMPATLRVSGFYNGGSGHQINVQVYNYSLAAYETLGTMLSRSTPFDYAVPMTDDHHNGSTGEMKVRFLHSVGTYNPSHVLNLDYIAFEKVGVTDSMAGDIAAIRVQTDQFQFTLGRVRATLAGNGNVSVDWNYDNGTTVYDLRALVSGQPLEGCHMRVYLSADWTAGLRTEQYIKDEATTDAAGKQDHAFRLVAGDYVVDYDPPSGYQSTQQSITVV